MLPSPPSTGTAFRGLGRHLLARRLASIEPAVRAMLAVTMLLIAAFVYWQMRVPLAGAVHAGGVMAAFPRLALVLASLVTLAAGLTYGAAGRFTAQPPGPEWLALPVPSARVERHALAEARRPAWFVFPVALAALLAGAGLVPPAWLMLAAATFVVAWLEGTRLAHAIAWRRAPTARSGAAGRSLATRVLAGARLRAPRSRRRPADWRARGPVAAIGALDRARTFTESAPHRAALAGAGFALAGLAAWALPRPPIERAALAFAGQMLTAAALGAWAASLVTGDPASLWRPLPLAPRRVWGARVRPLVIAMLVLPIAHAACAAPLGAPARAGIVLSWPIPALLVATLGLHHALSLYPDARAASRVTTTWLGVSVAASLMIPLLGWIVLFAGAVHAARRVARGFHSETR